MDLPTYTNIWRIEKRLYKLYDLRLPMPLPVVWIGVFLGVLAVWTLLLRLLRVPFETPWHVLYLVPPGVVTWLSTRPVIENKRLTELLQSQLRYLGEPRTWCRMAPATEPDEIRFEARVWRLPPEAAHALAAKRAKRRAKAEAAARKRARGRATSPATVPAAPAAKSPAPSPARALRGRAATSAAPPLAIGAGEPAAGSGNGARARAGAPAEPALRPAEPTPVAATPAVPGDDAADRHVVGEINPAVAAAAAAVTGARADADAAGDGATARRDRGRARADDGTAARHKEAVTAGRPDDAERGVAEPVPVASASTDAARTADDGAGAERPLQWGDVTTPPWSSAAAAADETGASVETREDDAVTSPGGGVVRLLPVLGTDVRVARRRGERGPAASGSTPEAGDRPATPAGLGVEALRRLRRLATGAERTAETGPAEAPTTPSPSAEPSPVAAETAHTTARRAEAAPDRAATAPATGGPDRPADATADEPVTAASTAASTAPSGATTDAAAAHGTAHGTAVGGTAPTAAPQQDARPPEAGRTSAAAEDAAADDDLAEARRQHRRGRPPRRSRPPQRRGPATPVTIRAVPAPDPAEATNPAAPAVPDPAVRRFPEPKVRRVEAVVGRDTSGGWRRLAQVVVGVGTGRSDGSEIDEARARSAISTSKRIVVLGCTGGAGQTTTALMLGHTLATYREDRVLAVDANTGPRTLSHMIAAESPETLTSLLEGLDEVSGYLSMRAYTTRCASGLEVIAADTDEHATQRLADRSILSDQRLAEAIRMLDRHYKLILIDPAAAVAARVLPYADQLILVAPASADAPDAIAMTYDWLDGHGCSDLRRRAVLVVNGVSRRSQEDVEQAESVASGRCRAIVRVPWDEELAPGGTEPLELGHLRAATRRAYVALAGVVASGLGAERLRDRAARAANEDR
ncbi:hypothetical protein GCM10010106_32610 [Thermopolyspora flexuosa]|uniref:MinD-like ATPase involved in chromosome partitioning or flagellar assembly n=1 Tax=Thermopolyspora flexuosa TaxID=103836 RepID=A0A543IT02_9ACTN|nr:conjugal transfer protein [Thermopolyspora flexuosa]TQM73704.1 MinD-like ATPase involved in chromosome partitioning or flagellar assembly [Thermopolyspora flexuosa]GGM83441.1 hypothetical protein GCM10010106_32610 [Thermopolyspora flexuosa]